MSFIIPKNIVHYEVRFTSLDGMPIIMFSKNPIATLEHIYLVYGSVEITIKPIKVN